MRLRVPQQERRKKRFFLQQLSKYSDFRQKKVSFKNLGEQALPANKLSPMGRRICIKRFPSEVSQIVVAP